MTIVVFDRVNRSRIPHRGAGPSAGCWPSVKRTRLPHRSHDSSTGSERPFEPATTGERRRHHLHESVLQRAVKDAVRRAGIASSRLPHVPSLVHHAPCWRVVTTSGQFRNCSATAT